MSTLPTAKEFYDAHYSDDTVVIMRDYAEMLTNNMYSEEDMIEFAEFVTTYPDKNKNVNGEILHAKSKYDSAERTIDLLKEFKKK